jgi:transcriptional regulator with XRE-family HTH domain
MAHLAKSRWPWRVWGSALRRLRIERGLSQRDLASPDVSSAYISRIEADARRPSAKTLQAVAEKLGYTAPYLATGDDDVVCLFRGRGPHTHADPGWGIQV